MKALWRGQVLAQPRGLSPALIGRTLFHAYAAFDVPGTAQARFASNPFPLHRAVSTRDRPPLRIACPPGLCRVPAEQPPPARSHLSRATLRLRALSSVGQSGRLIISWSQVRVLQGPQHCISAARRGTAADTKRLWEGALGIWARIDASPRARARWGAW